MKSYFRSLKARLLYGDYYHSYKDTMISILDYYLSQGKKIAAWGYGLKGETFLRIIDKDGERITCVVDLKKELQGSKTITKKDIISYTVLNNYKIDIILVMNKVYFANIAGILNTEGYKCELIDVDELIENKLSYEKVIQHKIFSNKNKIEYNLDSMHKQVMIVMKEIDRICQKHNIEYFLCAGSVLGAVRHKGFIPWDEDIDVGMIRKEYDRFVEIVKKELKDGFFYHLPQKDMDYYKPYLKIYKNNTSYVRYELSRLKIHHGLHVDIFPFDNVSNISEEREKQAKKVIRYSQLLYQKKVKIIYENKNPLKCLIVNFWYYVLKCVSFKYIYYKLNQSLKLKEHEDTSYVADLCTPYTTQNKTMYFNRADIVPVKMLQFEDDIFPVPNNPHVYLSMMYGDYMTPPPEGKRLQKYRLVEVAYDRNYYLDNTWLKKIEKE